MFGRNTTAVVMAGLIGAVMVMAPALANAKMREIYRFSGLVVGLPAGDLDVDAFPIVDPEDANRIAILHCANLGNKNARVRVAYFDESGEPFVFDKRLESNTGFTLTTSNEGVSGIALDFIDIEQIKAGLGLVLASRTEIACSAQVLNRFSQYVYDLPLERVGRDGE
jgi:hypothetical protein